MLCLWKGSNTKSNNQPLFKERSGWKARETETEREKALKTKQTEIKTETHKTFSGLDLSRTHARTHAHNAAGVQASNSSGCVWAGEERQWGGGAGKAKSVI